MFQCTINRPIMLSGIGLHSGHRINMTLRPADARSGIVFNRTDGERVVSIAAIAENVVDTRLATVLGRGSCTLSTVEHLLAALHAVGIDNVQIDIDGPEVPVLDGSALPFVLLLQEAGVRRQPFSRRFLAIRRPLSLVDGEKRITVIPSRFFRVSCDIAFEHPCIGMQHRTCKVSQASFRKDIAPARTFGFLKEVEYLKSVGLARGGSLDNAVVIGEDRILNPEGLRYPDEFVRHKILDAIGDFSLLGHRLLGHIKTFKAGHDMNHRMVEKILANSDSWRLVEFAPDDLRKVLYGRLSVLGNDLTALEA